MREGAGRSVVCAGGGDTGTAVDSGAVTTMLTSSLLQVRSPPSSLLQVKSPPSSLLQVRPPAPSLLQVRPAPGPEPGLQQVRLVLEDSLGCRVELGGVRRLPRPQAGHTAELAAVEAVVTEDTGAVSRLALLVKTVGEQPAGAGGCGHTRFLTREVTFYTVILPRMVEASPGLATRLPRCYHGSAHCHAPAPCCLPWPWPRTSCGEAGLLVLEDVARSELDPRPELDRSELLSLDQVEAALFTLAHFHGAASRWLHCGAPSLQQQRSR